MPVLAEALTYTRTPEIFPDQIHSFIQIFIKQGENVGSMTYFLPEKISREETEILLTGILDGTPHYYESTPSGGLTFVARAGVDAMSAIRRFVDLPGELFEIDQRGRWEQLANGVINEVRQCLAGERLVGPQETVGETIYGFGFKLTGEEWEGKGVNNQPTYLSKLARGDCEEHKVFLPKMSETLRDMKDGIMIQLAQDGTVGECCPVFAAGKTTKMNGSRDFTGGGKIREGIGTSRCNTCGQVYRVSSGHECGSEAELDQ